MSLLCSSRLLPSPFCLLVPIFAACYSCYPGLVFHSLFLAFHGLSLFLDFSLVARACFMFVQPACSLCLHLGPQPLKKTKKTKTKKKLCLMLTSMQFELKCLPSFSLQTVCLFPNWTIFFFLTMSPCPQI